jgi:hypothetical protein
MIYLCLKFMITFASCFNNASNPKVHGSYTEALVESNPAYWECSPPLASRQVTPSWAMRWDATILALSYTNVSIESVHPTLGAIVRSNLLHSFFTGVRCTIMISQNHFPEPYGQFFWLFFHPISLCRVTYWTQPLEIDALLVMSVLCD